MATLLSLKRRIRTAQGVSKTTRAMQMIAASKLKKARDAALSSRPYVDKLKTLSENLVYKLEAEQYHDYMKTPKAQNSLLIVFSPNKGLCGGLVTNITREFLQFIEQKKELSYIITVGKKAEHIARLSQKEIIASFPLGAILPSFSMVYPILQIVDDYFLTNKVSRVEIIFPRFESLFSQTPSVTTLLPVTLPETQLEKTQTLTLFEPKPQELLPTLLRHYLETSIYQYLLETYLSENAARMLAMKNATDNALEMIEILNLEYNKSRQERITNEILDITGAGVGLAVL